MRARLAAALSGREAYLFVAPLLAAVFALIVFPIAGTLLSSFYSDVSFLGREFVWLGNYLQAFSDPGFRQSLGFTLMFIAAAVPLELAIGTAFAVVLDQELPLRGLWRASVLIPWAIPSAVSARIWELIYNYNYGLANMLLGVSGLSSAPVNWTGSAPGAFLALLAADVWKTAPFVALIVLAGLQAVPQDLRWQARIDRATSWQAFRLVTLPLLKPVLVVALLFRTIDTLRIFDVIYVLTGGGPGGATTSVSLYAYRYFAGGDFGYGSAVSMILFAVSFGLSYLYVRLSGFREGAV
ncbi:MAG: sugar ABC transporter permease [Elusimicrobia bacterium]|nr:sugar ABC transporter permease [Elusimicrobiota bacterium]